MSQLRCQDLPSGYSNDGATNDDCFAVISTPVPLGIASHSGSTLPWMRIPHLPLSRLFDGCCRMIQRPSPPSGSGTQYHHGIS